MKRARGVGAGLGIAELGRSGSEPGLINVANADKFKSFVGEKRLGVVHPTFAHADDDDAIGFHAFLSHSRHFAMT